MKPTLDHVLSSLSRQELLQAIALVQRRRDLSELLLGLLQARLNSLVTTNGHTHRDREEWLTVKAVAHELRLTRPYVYELIREGELRSVKIPGERGYVRVPRESLDRFIKENAQKEASF